MLFAQFSLTWECIYNRDIDDEPKGLVETIHESWETNEKYISIIRDGPRDENINTIWKWEGRQHEKGKS